MRILKSLFYEKSHYRVVHEFERNLALLPEFKFKWQSILIDEFYEEVANEQSEIKSYLKKTTLGLIKVLNGICEINEIWVTHPKLANFNSCNFSSHCGSLTQNMKTISSEDLMESNLIEMKNIHKEAFGPFSAFYLGVHLDREAFRKSKLYKQVDMFHSFQFDEMFRKPLENDTINDTEIVKVLKNTYNEFLQISDRYEGCMESIVDLEDKENTLRNDTLKSFEHDLKHLILRLHLLFCLSDIQMIFYNSNNFSINFLLIAQITLGILFSLLPFIPISIHFGFEFLYCYIYRKIYGYSYKVNGKLFFMKLIFKSNSKKIILQNIKLKMKKGSHKK